MRIRKKDEVAVEVEAASNDLFTLGGTKPNNQYKHGVGNRVGESPVLSFDPVFRLLPCHNLRFQGCSCCVVAELRHSGSHVMRLSVLVEETGAEDPNFQTVLRS
jgi:hypothetical protein